MSERDEARRATILAYRHKCTKGVALKGQGPLLGEPKINYRGDFPYQSVAAVCETPRQFTTDEINLGIQKIGVEARVNVHAPYWAKLFRMFDEEWQNYVRDRQRATA